MGDSIELSREIERQELKLWNDKVRLAQEIHEAPEFDDMLQAFIDQNANEALHLFNSITLREARRAAEELLTDLYAREFD